MSSSYITYVYLQNKQINMNQKFVVIAISNGIPECYGSFKKFCVTKGNELNKSYQSFLNKKEAPKPGKPVKIGDYTIYKVEAI